jgi:spermidine synthase
LALAAAGLFTVLVPLVFMRQVAGGSSVHYTPNLGGFLWRWFGLTVTSLGPALVFAGLIFPLCVMGCGGQGLSRRLGTILAINGAGGLLGAEISIRLLLPALGVHQAIGAVGCLYSALSLLFGLRFYPSSRMALQFILIAPVLTVFLFMQTLPRLPVFVKPEYKTIEVNSGYEGTLAVVEGERLGRAMIFDNQYVLGGSRAASEMERQTHIPLLLHPCPTRVGFLGLGTGITASGALRHGPVKSITAVELSPLVARAAATRFSEFNHNFCARTNVNVLVEDARTHLAVSRQHYDVIIGDLFTPWRPGEASLCELELFQAARAALRSGGIYCQWIPMHQLTPAQFEVIARTFQKAFPEAIQFRNHFKTRGLPLALIGFKDRRLDWAIVSQRCASERQRGQLSDPICRHPEGLAMLYMGRLDGLAAVNGQMNTRKNLWLELDAGQKWILGRKEEYFSGSGDLWLKLLQKRADRERENSDLPASLSPWPATGLLLSKYEIATEQDSSAALRIYSQLKAQLPSALLSDYAADWSLWPGSQSPIP